MATKASNQNQPSDTSPRSKRRLRPTETVREQQVKSQANAEKPKRRILRGRFGWISWPFRKVAAWSFWQSKAWKPFKFVGKVLGYILFIPYLRSSWHELRQVTWPKWRQSIRLTFAVIMFAVVFGVIIAIVDYGLDKAFRKVILNS